MSAKAQHWLFAVAAAVLVCGALAVVNWPRIASATAASQFNSVILARSFFEKIVIRSGEDERVDYAKVQLVANDPSDVYVVKNTVAPGGDSGWHLHPGPSLVLVSTGMATVYDGGDPSCTPVRYPAGTGFSDPAGRVHLVRNESGVPLETVAFQIVPGGASRRIDAPSPGFCPF